MALTYGFYNSLNGDRRYNAIQMSSIFDGIIRDGIFQHVGTAMEVKASEAMLINVGIGRAWFNHTWTLNDALLPLIVPMSEVILNRIDAVIIEVDTRENVRANSIHIVKGTPASDPIKPSMIKTNDRWQYPLAYIRVNAGVTSIRQADITNCIGTSESPFVTAPLDKVSIDALFAQWEDQWRAFYEKETAEMEATFSLHKEMVADCYTQYAADVAVYVQRIITFEQMAQTDFQTWFTSLKNILDENAEGHILSLITNLTDRVTLIEAVLFNDIQTNPFIIQFDNLDGVDITGVWNASLQRVEC